jgi:hypothetical protein
MVGPEVLMERGEYTALESGTRRQLLVVDDDMDIQKLLSRTLALMGYDVNLAGNGREAMNLFVTKPYDLVGCGNPPPLGVVMSFGYALEPFTEIAVAKP